jgi:hypothetical protein
METAVLQFSLFQCLVRVLVYVVVYPIVMGLSFCCVAFVCMWSPLRFSVSYSNLASYDAYDAKDKSIL